MGLETATFVDDLVATNPVGASDAKSQGDNHLRLIKAALKATFPNADHAIYLEQAQADLTSVGGAPDLGAQTTNFIRITGTTTITSFGTVAAGVWKFLRFAAALTLTHHATSLILPSAANITTAANDTALVMSLGSGNWLVLAYQKADGSPVVTGSSVTMASLTDGDSWTAEVSVNSSSGDILGAASNFIALTGTTTITSFGTGANKLKFVRFTGIMTLTHNATSLILPTGANITTAVGDTCVVVSDGSSNARVLAYQRANGSAVASVGLPVGTVVPYAGATAPSGWLLAYGQAISRTTYADLFTAIDTTYGVGDGSTTFNVPDLRGRVVAGQDDMGGSSANRLTGVTGSVNGDTLGGTGGEETHALTGAEIPDNATSGTVQASGSTSNKLTTHTGTGDAHNNVQPTIILNYIIYAGV